MADSSSEKRTILLHSFLLSSSTYYSMILNAITGFFVAKILGTVNFGVLSGLQIIWLFVSMCHLGFLFSCNVTLPSLRAKGDEDGIQKTLSITFHMVMVPTLIASLIILGVAFWKKGQIETFVFWGIVALSFQLLFSQIQNLIINTHIRSWNRFNIQSIAQMIVSTAINPLLMISVIYCGIYGQYGANLLQHLIFILVVGRFISLRFGSGWSKEIWLNMFRIGFPMLLVMFLTVSTRNIDRLMILGILKGEEGLSALGVYTLGVRVMEFLLGIVMVVFSIMLPRFQERYTKSGKRAESLVELIEGPSLLLVTVMATATALSVVGFDYLLSNFMDEYKNGILAMKLLAWSAALSSVSILFGITLITLDRNWLRFGTSGLSLVVTGSGELVYAKAWIWNYRCRSRQGFWYVDYG